MPAVGKACLKVALVTAVVFVEYTRAPEARFPVAIEEAYAAGYAGKNVMGSGFDIDLDEAQRIRRQRAASDHEQRAHNAPHHLAQEVEGEGREGGEES